jgi:hypothetical protein
MQTNSRVVSESLESYAVGLLAESAFFSALPAGEADPGHVRDIFGQYYLWRNRFHYGVTSGLEFFSPLGEEAKHSRATWRAIIGGRRANTERLVEAARLEIWEHITFWDDVYYAILGMENELAS